MMRKFVKNSLGFPTLLSCASEDDDFLGHFSHFSEVFGFEELVMIGSFLLLSITTLSPLSHLSILFRNVQ